MTVYEPLTNNTAIALAQRLEIFDESAALTSKEIGDGNLNLIFHIVNELTKQGVIIKQALPYSKVVSKRWPLSLRRATIESNSLLTNASYVPHLVPKVYYSDETLAITVMEDLSHLKISRTGLIEGENYPLLSKHMGEYLAKTLFYTSDFGLDQRHKKELVKKFINPDLCKITEDLVFTDPFFDHETNDYEVELQQDVELLWTDNQIKLEVAKLKKKFLTQADALLHGDLHTGSIFASVTETKVIDPEFAFFGPFGFDIGQFIANLLINAISRHEQNQEILFSHIEKTWEVFSDTFTILCETAGVEVYTKLDGYLAHILNQSFEDAVGFAGCELIRRAIGLAHVADLDGICDQDRKIEAKRHALELGKSLILNRGEINQPSNLREYFQSTLLVRK